ncbi:MAG: ribosome maturation factor RimM [Bacilli bacterium]|nr:ribosome maturation factor RimM [Bacilli bacterium]
MTEPWITVGTIVNTQGIGGEVRVISHTDFPEQRFTKGSVLTLEHAELAGPIKLTVEGSRPHKGFTLVKFQDLSSINDVEKYKGGQLKVAKTELALLPEDTFYIHDLIGCEVVDEQGSPIGVLIDVLQPGANDVYVVKPPQGNDILLPVIRSCILEVRIPAKLVIARIPEGLLD